MNRRDNFKPDPLEAAIIAAQNRRYAIAKVIKIIYAILLGIAIVGRIVTDARTNPVLDTICLIVIGVASFGLILSSFLSILSDVGWRDLLVLVVIMITGGLCVVGIIGVMDRADTWAAFPKAILGLVLIGSFIAVLFGAVRLQENYQRQADEIDYLKRHLSETEAYKAGYFEGYSAARNKEDRNEM